MKIISMIPARLGSTRVKNKNLRLLDGKPLVHYIIESAKNSELIDEIYINSEAKVFEEIAENSKVKFYQRDKSLSSNESTNDDFAIDFMSKVSGDILIQLLPTSPFINSDEIDSFIKKMLDEKLDTLVSVSNVQIESMFNGKPLNFDLSKKTPPSQLLEPIKAYACGIMGWKYDKFISNMNKFGAAYHGGDGKTGYYTLDGFATVDIDNEDDFKLAESICVSRKKSVKNPEYYKEKEKLILDSDRKRILEQDGVLKNILNNYNKEIASIDKIVNDNAKDKSWSFTLVNSLSNCVTLIAQMPGEGNRKHYHADWDEWWYIVKGEWEWNIEGTPKTVKRGDLVFINRNRVHKITAKGNELAIRLAVSREDVDHIYQEDDF